MHITPNTAQKLAYSDLLEEIALSLSTAQDYIYATHFLLKEEDMDLPQRYREALVYSPCSIRKRVIFGNMSLFSRFSQNEKYGFTNLYTTDIHYQRMLMIDSMTYFLYQDSFYRTEIPSDQKMFLEYFESLNTVSL